MANCTSNVEKLLIIHADDLGVTHSVNAATFAAIASHSVSSASIMPTCPWFLDAIHRAKNLEFDLGVHLTLTSEWPNYRWSSLSRTPLLGNLLDSAGFLHQNLYSSMTIPALDLFRELDSQIRRVIDCGISISHIDTHMRSVFTRPDWFRIYLALANKYNLYCLRLQDTWPTVMEEDAISSRLAPTLCEFQVPPTISPEDWLNFYCDTLSAMRPGLNFLAVHLGFDNDELRAAMGTDTEWGSRWRQRDYDVVSSASFRSHLKACEINLIGWRDLGRLVR